MGRAKIAMEFISKEKARNSTYANRKSGLLKKGYEFSILCNVPVCMIIYPYKQEKVSLEGEVYSFKGDVETASNDDPLDVILDRARDPNMAREIIDRYLRVPMEEKSRRSLNLCDMSDDRKSHKNNGLLTKYPCWDCGLDGLNSDQLMELVANLDQKIEFVRKRIDNINQLVPYFEQTPVPISISEFQMGYPEFQGFPQEYFHQIVPYNQNQNQNMYTDHRVDGHGHGSSNMVMYNMNMMGGPGPFFDHVVGPTPSYGFPNNVSLMFPYTYQGCCSLEGHDVGESSSNVRHQVVGWNAPQESWYALNIDGVAKGNPGPAGGGAIIRDHQGSFVSALSANFGHSSSFKAQLMALTRGLELAKQLQIQKLVIQLDNLANSVHVLHHRKENASDQLLDYCQQMINSPDWSVKVIRVHPQGNCAANWLANQGVVQETRLHIFNFAPVHLATILEQDRHSNSSLVV